MSKFDVTDALVETISVLRSKEKKLIKNWLGHQTVKASKKRLQLFELICRETKTDKNLSWAKIQNLIYPNSLNNSASKMSHLKARLMQDVLNIVLLQSSNKISKTAYSRAGFDAKRLTLQAELLYSRGAIRTGNFLSTKSYKLSKEFELWDLTLNKLIWSRNRDSRIQLHPTFLEIQNQEEEIFKEVKAMNEVLKMRTQLVKPKYSSQAFTKDYKIQGTKLILQNEERLEEINSEQTKLYHYWTKTEFLRNILDYRGAMEAANIWLQIIKNKTLFPTLGFYPPAAMAKLSLSILAQGPESGETEKSELLKLWDNYTGINWFLIGEILFFYEFRKNRIREAAALLDKIIGHKKISFFPLLKAKYTFLGACLNYSRNTNEGTLDHTVFGPLYNDKTGWYLGERIFEMMRLAEEKNWEILGYRVLAFRQHLNRHRENNNARPSAIHKVFRDLLKTASFKETKSRMAGALESLRKGRSRFSWDPMGWEFIRFDSWFNAKASRTSRK